MNLFLVSLDSNKNERIFYFAKQAEKAGSWLDAVFSKMCCIRAISIGKNMGNQFSMHKKHYIC